MAVFVARATGAIKEQRVPRVVAAEDDVNVARSESKQATFFKFGAVPPYGAPCRIRLRPIPATCCPSSPTVQAAREVA